MSDGAAVQAGDSQQTLRLKYNVAWTAHEQCARAVTDVRFRGEEPSPELIEQEVRARQALNDAREQLRIAMTESITGHHAILAEHSRVPPFSSDTLLDSPQAPKR